MMNMISESKIPMICIVYHGLICSLLLSGIIFLIVKKNPRIFLSGYPGSIRNIVPGATKEEKQQAVWFNIAFIAIMVGYPLIAGWYYQHQKTAGFWQLLLFIWGILFVFNLFDLIIIDWLIICIITPDMFVIPGTKGARGYKDFRFHFIAFLKGIFITLAMAAVLTLIIEEIVLLKK